MSFRKIKKIHLYLNLLIKRNYSFIKSAPNPEVDRIKYVTSFYYHPSIDQAAVKSTFRLLPLTMLYTGSSSDKRHLIQSARYLQRELPIRLAHQVTKFRDLPFIVACHPLLLSIQNLYINSFHKFNEIPEINSLESELSYCELLKDFLDRHRKDVHCLSAGLKEARNFVQNDRDLKIFLEKIVNSRIAMELLCKHHIFLQNEQPHIIGIIEKKFSPCNVIQAKIRSVKKLCTEIYEACPDFNLSGSVDANFAYIPQPFGNIMHEILYNAAKATILNYPLETCSSMPPIQVSISTNSLDFVVKVSDKGKGIKANILDKIWEYDLAKHHATENEAGLLSDELIFGMAVCRTYANSLGGTIKIETMDGYGTDVFLRLAHIEGQGETFRI